MVIFALVSYQNLLEAGVSEFNEPERTFFPWYDLLSPKLTGKSLLMIEDYIKLRLKLK